MTAFEVFYDGECPLCRREIELVRRLDPGGRVRCTDIAAPSFDASPLGRSHEELMARIHGRLPDGRLVEGVEVFRRMYAAISPGVLGPLVALTRLPPLSWALDASYRWFAKNRLRLTGRCTDDACSTHAAR